MAKAKFERTKPHCNIGTIGHVDHGKTSLTAAITKVLAETGGATYTTQANTDQAPEARYRGLTTTTAPSKSETQARHHSPHACQRLTAPTHGSHARQGPSRTLPRSTPARPPPHPSLRSPSSGVPAAAQ